jgi:hypothetical protein
MYLEIYNEGILFAFSEQASGLSWEQNRAGFSWRILKEAIP